MFWCGFLYSNRYFEYFILRERESEEKERERDVRLLINNREGRLCYNLVVGSIFDVVWIFNIFWGILDVSDVINIYLWVCII